MEREKYTREFKLEAVNLVRDRGVAIVQVARALDFNHNMLRRWLKELDADPNHAFTGLGQSRYISQPRSLRNRCGLCPPTLPLFTFPQSCSYLAQRTAVALRN